MKKLPILIASLFILFVIPNVSFSQEEEEEELQARPNPEEKGVKARLRPGVGSRANTLDPVGPGISPAGSKMNGRWPPKESVRTSGGGAVQQTPPRSRPRPPPSA